MYLFPPLVGPPPIVRPQNHSRHSRGSSPVSEGPPLLVLTAKDWSYPTAFPRSGLGEPFTDLRSTPTCWFFPPSFALCSLWNGRVNLLLALRNLLSRPPISLPARVLSVPQGLLRSLVEVRFSFCVVFWFFFVPRRFPLYLAQTWDRRHAQPSLFSRHVRPSLSCDLPFSPQSPGLLLQPRRGRKHKSLDLPCQ